MHISTNTIYTFCALIVCAVLPLSVHAETVVRVAESVSIVADQTVEEDFYAAGGIVTMSGDIKGDMYAAGGSVTTNGTIAADLSALGGTVQVHGPVADDVRIVGGDVKIAEDVGGDVFVFSGTLTILSSATITGNVYFYGGEAEINGAVEGSIFGAADRIRVDSAVGGDIDVTASRALILGNRAAVAGDIRYASLGRLERAQNAVVEGEIIEREQIVDETAGFGIGSIVVSFVIHAFALLTLFIAFRTELESFARTAIRRVGRNGLVGAGILVAAPVTVLLLIVTVLGSLLGMVGMGLVIASFGAAYILSGAIVGMVLAQLIVKRTELSVLWLLAGTLALHVAWAVPVIGPLVVFTAFMVSLGSIGTRIYFSMRRS